MPIKIVLVGAGNAGYHLGIHLSEHTELLQVFSRTEGKARRLSRLTNVPFTTSLAALNKAADIYMLAIHDDGISGVADQLFKLGLSDKLVCHTSGATPISVFEKSGLRRYGIFYPLQTFSIGRPADFEQIPFIVDANNAGDAAILDNLAALFTKKIYHLSDEKRAALHVAAVFVNNFTNHLFDSGKRIMDLETLPFELLLPLILETVDKLKSANPADVQTGPAIRGDVKTIARHLDYLTKYPDLRELYVTLTNSIRKGL